MKTRVLIVLGLCIFVLTSCSSVSWVLPLETVEYVDVEQYMGKWYEIASYPTFFNTNCTATTAEYTLQNDGSVKVINECRIGSPTGRLNRIEGTARVVDETTNAELKVMFSFFAQGDYWIIALDDEYQWAVVGDPGRTTLFVLSRTPTMDDNTYEEILTLIRGSCYDPDNLVLTTQVPDD